MDRLLREGNPPTGQLASPKPQYKDVQTNNWEELKGEGGASYVKDRDALAKLEQVRVLLAGVATETKLEEARALLESVAGKDFATQATLAQVKSELELVKAELAAIKANQLSGDQKVQLSGTIVELASSWNISVTAGSTVTLYENTTKQYPARSIRASASGYSSFNKARLAIRFWNRGDHMSANHYAVSSEVVEVDDPYLHARVEADVYGGFCRVALTNLMTTDGVLASFVVLGVI